MPGAPTAVKAKEGIGYVAISWTAPAVDESEDTAEADRRSAAEFYRYQVTTALTGDNIPNFTGAAIKIRAADSPTSHTALGLTADTYYFRVQAANTKGTGDWSAASAGATVTRVLADGGWTYRLDISPSTITPGSATGAEVSLVATWTAHAVDVGKIVSLSVKGGGGGGGVGHSPVGRLRHRQWRCLGHNAKVVHRRGARGLRQEHRGRPHHLHYCHYRWKHETLRRCGGQPWVVLSFDNCQHVKVLTYSFGEWYYPG